MTVFKYNQAKNDTRIFNEKFSDLNFLNENYNVFKIGAAKSRLTEDKIIINFFNPECEHCQYMTQQFVKNSDKLKDILLVMVTISDSAETAKFKTEYHLDSLKHFVLLRDAKDEFPRIFGTSVVPSFFVYQNNKLVKKIIGETKVENLIN